MKPPVATFLSATAALACGVTPNAAAAGSFQEMSEHLDLDGTFVGYAEFSYKGLFFGLPAGVARGFWETPSLDLSGRLSSSTGLAAAWRHDL